MKGVDATTTSQWVARAAVLLWLVCLCPIPTANAAPNVTVVHIGPLSGDYVNIGLQAKKSIELAAQAINQDPSLLPGIQFIVEHVDSRSNLGAAAYLAFQYGYEKNFPLFIGDVDSAVSGTVALIGGLFGIPQGTRVHHGAFPLLLTQHLFQCPMHLRLQHCLT